MATRFTVLASGSAGNSSLLQAGDFGLMIDFGLGVRRLAERLAARGCTWRSVDAAILTHTHGDHWSETALAALVKHGGRLVCHAEHAGRLTEWSEAFRGLTAAGLVSHYDAGRWLDFDGRLRVLPVPVSHDCGPTFAFRVEGPAGLYGPEWSLGYAADLGCWQDGLAELLADVDLLAIEFNHDVHLQRTSGRPLPLIQRVLGDHGHLSNAQAAELLLAVRRHSRHAGPRTVVPLHLSRECNTVELAMAAAVPAAGEHARVIAATQDMPTATIRLGHDVPRGRAARRRVVPSTAPELFANFG
jgi:phosphoribosyl 1,2-cyclic phosphodiesterase